MGMLSVLIGIYLGHLGFGLAKIGLFLTLGTAGSAAQALFVGLAASVMGRRALLVGFSLLAAAAGLFIGFTQVFGVLAAIAFFGALSASGGSGGGSGFGPLEQATLPDTTDSTNRTRLFAVYGIVGTVSGAVGALAAGLPTLIQAHTSLGQTGSERVMFFAFGALLGVSALLYLVLSSNLGRPEGGGEWANPFKLESRRRIFTLTGLFSVDRFAGAMVIQSLVAYWFSTRFGFQLDAVAGIFFLSNVLAAISLWLAAKLADRIGLLNTMVFTHIPSSLFLIGAAFSPFGWLAVVFWEARSFLGQMDVPTRNSYTMAIVQPEERVAMASTNIVGSSVAASAGPSVGALLWHALSAGVPFVACGVLKIGYDLTLFFMFRNVVPEEELARRKARGG